MASAVSGLQRIVGTWPIRYKLLAIAMATGALSLLILSTAFILYHTYIARTSLERELTAAAEIVGRNSTAALLFGDKKAAQETLDALRTRPDIIAARIENAEGEAFAAIPSGDGSPDSAVSPASQETIDVLVPVENDGKRIGQIRLWASLDRLAAEQRVFALVAILTALLAALAGFAMSTLLQPIITRPLSQLTHVMAEVSERKDYTLRAPLTTSGDVAILINGFNGMLAEIERQHGELERYRATLEEQVAERTSELSASNQQLRQTIEELERAKLQAEAASKAKSDFLANMSHELRTPLNAIIGFSDLMKSEMLGPIGNDTYRGYISDIHFSGSHLLEVINDILDVVRHESGKMELKEEKIAIGEIIADALRLIAPQARDGQVNLSWRRSSTPLPALFCDRVRVRQMLLNILSNAVKFTEPGGNIEIKTEVTRGLELIVKDNGIGIEPDDLARILMPFGQVASVYTRNHQGTGLGLTLTKSLIERHGGQLSIYSLPGLGTTVRLSFPPERLERCQTDPIAIQIAQ